MKKIIALLLALCLIFAFTACGEKKEEDKKEEEPTGTKVYVSIATAGEVKLAAEAIYVNDTNSDGTLSIDEVLTQAHEQKSPNGAASYASADSGYGLAISKLWDDENGGSYGIYVNNIAVVTSLAEAVKEGDHIYAYSYKDLTSWSDIFAHFDTFKVTSENGEVSLHVSADGYDEAWNPIVINVEGAEIVAGGKTYGTTDAEGNITINIPGSGEYTIIAYHNEKAMVPAICLVTVK